MPRRHFSSASSFDYSSKSRLSLKKMNQIRYLHLVYLLQLSQSSGICQKSIDCVNDRFRIILVILDKPSVTAHSSNHKLLFFNNNIVWSCYSKKD